MKFKIRTTTSLLLIFGTPLIAADKGIIPTPDYTGSFFERSTLTGDWNGVRQGLANHGLQADFKVVTTYQNLFDGGIDSDDGFVSTQNLLIQLDTGKADLWEGGLLKIRVESRVGESLDSVGSYSPTNANALFPSDVDRVNEETIGITELVYTQFLTPKFGIQAGLMNTLTSNANELAGSLENTSRFMNASFLLSLPELQTVPSSTLGAALIFIPAEWLLGSVIILDTEESATKNPFKTSKGSTLGTEWKVKYQPAGLPGAQTFGFLYAFDNEFTTLDQDARASFPLGDPLSNSAKKSSDSWAFYHNAHQYLQYQEGRGWGVFSRFSFADNDTNPIDWTVSAGISGNGLFELRPNDTFGLGYYHMEFTSSDLQRINDANEENGFEVWYNAELTPWFHLTADLQIIDTALGKPDGIIATANGSPEGETAWIVGVRTEITF